MECSAARSRFSVTHTIALEMIFFFRMASSLLSLVPTCHEFSRLQGSEKAGSTSSVPCPSMLYGELLRLTNVKTKLKMCFELLALCITVVKVIRNTRKNTSPETACFWAVTLRYFYSSSVQPAVEKMACKRLVI
jgi:hypothetical protein